MTAPADQPPARRRRVAPALPDPMGPTVPAPASALPVEPALPARAVEAASPRRARSVRPTVAILVRVDEDAAARFKELAADAGLSQRRYFEQLVDQAWRSR